MSDTHRGLSGLIKRAYASFDGALVRIFVFMVVGAAVLSIVENTTARAPDGLAYYKLLMLGLGAIIAELMGVHRAIVAWHGAHRGQTFAWAAVWAVGFVFSIYNAIGSAAETQVKRANVQKAALTSYQDARTGIDGARARVTADEKSLADLKGMTWQAMPQVAGKTIMSVDAASALIATYEGNARFWDLTKSCTDAQGPQARKFCKEHGEAKAAKADLAERAKWQARIDAAEKQLNDAREALKAALAQGGQTATQTSDVTPFVGLASYVTGAEPEKIQWIETFQTSVTNMVLVSLAGLVMALMHIQGRDRTPWFDLRGLSNRISRVWNGAPAAPTPLAAEVPPAQQDAAPIAQTYVAPIELPKPIAAPASSSLNLRIEDDRGLKAIIEAIEKAYPGGRIVKA